MYEYSTKFSSLDYESNHEYGIDRWFVSCGHAGDDDI